MIINYKCDDCKLSSICQAKNKLKPFTEEAKVDLGVLLQMKECKTYIKETTEDFEDHEDFDSEE